MERHNLKEDIHVVWFRAYKYTQVIHFLMTLLLLICAGRLVFLTTEPLRLYPAPAVSPHVTVKPALLTAFMRPLPLHWHIARAPYVRNLQQCRTPAKIPQCPLSEQQ